uniref:Uncharacterized protein n=1 Tax=Rhizophora mucronata TaxID=61149 RepID=A0A2P2PMY7_RHIMU
MGLSQSFSRISSKNSLQIYLNHNNNILLLFRDLARQPSRSFH